MDQTKKYHESVKGNLPDVRFKLERLSEDVSKALEKIQKKENVLSRTF
jgi:ribosomal protein S12